MFYYKFQYYLYSVGKDTLAMKGENKLLKKNKNSNLAARIMKNNITDDNETIIITIETIQL